jgi:hypothetical protein
VWPDNAGAQTQPDRLLKVGKAQCQLLACPMPGAANYSSSKDATCNMAAVVKPIAQLAHMNTTLCVAAGGQLKAL